MKDVQVSETRAPEELTRRSFYIGAIYGLWATITAVLSLPALVYLFLPPKVRQQEEWVEVADFAKLPSNTPSEVVFRRNRVDGWKVLSEKSTAWVIRTGDTQVTAFGPQCTHLGCAYHWEQDKKHFLCPCHTSIFSIDGKVTAGPAPRPLDRYETKIEGTKLLLGKLQSPGSAEPKS